MHFVSFLFPNSLLCNYALSVTFAVYQCDWVKEKNHQKRRLKIVESREHDRWIGEPVTFSAREAPVSHQNVFYAFLSVRLSSLSLSNRLLNAYLPEQVIVGHEERKLQLCEQLLNGVVSVILQEQWLKLHFFWQRCWFNEPSGHCSLATDITVA